MAAIMLQTIPSFYTKVQKKASLFLQLRMKNTNRQYDKYKNTKYIRTDYCIARHDDKTCFLPARKYHIILFGNVEEFLKTLDTFCFTYQHVDCLYTLFKYRFSGKVFCKEWTSV